LVCTALLWSTGGLFLKSLPGVHWLAVAGVRSLFAGIVFSPGLRLPRPPLRKLIPVTVCYGLGVTALMGSMQLGTAAQGIWLQYIAPAVVALWAWRVQGQRPRPIETLALLLTGAAILLIVTGGSGPAHLWSLVLGLSSGIGYGFLILYLKDLSSFPPAAVNVWSNLGTAAIVLPAALIIGVPLPTVPRDVGLLAAMATFQLALAYYCFQHSLRGTRALEAALILLLEPILNPIWVYLVIHEMPSPRVIAGCALIACGLVAFALTPNRERAARGHQPEQPARPGIKRETGR
jgi:drug/metabolite transporter (DMT)-like permease